LNIDTGSGMTAASFSPFNVNNFPVGPSYQPMFTFMVVQVLAQLLVATSCTFAVAPAIRTNALLLSECARIHIYREKRI
jgi:hypothetical protein